MSHKLWLNIKFAGEWNTYIRSRERKAEFWLVHCWVPFTVNLKWYPLHIVGVSLLHKNISVAVKIVALKSVATLHFHVIFLFCDRFHWRRSFSFWCITSWSLTRIVNGIIIRSTWGSYTWYKWQLGRRGLKTLFKDLHRGEMNMNSETIYVTYNKDY